MWLTNEKKIVSGNVFVSATSQKRSTRFRSKIVPKRMIHARGSKSANHFGCDWQEGGGGGGGRVGMGASGKG